MTQQMKVKAKFDNFINLDQPTKSLINFFMKDALLYVYGKYVDKAFATYKTENSNIAFQAQQTGEVGNTYSLEFVQSQDGEQALITFKIAGETIDTFEEYFEYNDRLEFDDLQYNNDFAYYILPYTIESLSSGVGQGDGWISKDEIPAYGNDPLVITLSNVGYKGMYASIFSKNRVTHEREIPLRDSGIDSMLNDYSCLVVPYANNVSAGNTTDVAKRDLHVGGLPEYTTTLTQANSNLYIMRSKWNVEDNYPVYTFDYTINLSNPVTAVNLKPYISDNINTDESIMPSGISTEQGSYVSNITFSRQPSEKEYDFQLRTPTFSLHTYNSETHESADTPVYFKIGIYPIGNNTVDDIKTILTNNNKWFIVNCYHSNQEAVNYYNSVYLGFADYDKSDEYSYDGDINYFLTSTALLGEASLGNYLVEDRVPVLSRFIMPLNIQDNSDLEPGVQPPDPLKALLYFEMYNENKTVFDTSSLTGNLYYYGGENNSSWEEPSFANKLPSMLGLNMIELTSENDGTRIPVDSINFDEEDT